MTKEWILKYKYDGWVSRVKLPDLLCFEDKKQTNLIKQKIYKQGNGEYWLRFHHLTHGEREFTTWHLMHEISPYDPQWKMRIVG